VTKFVNDCREVDGGRCLGQIGLGFFMRIFLVMLVFSGIVLSFLAGVLLLTTGKYKRRANQLLAIVFFSVGFDAVCNLLFLTRVVLDFPVYLKLIVPLYYLIPPCIYLYICITLGVPGKKRYLWLHLIPSGIIAIETLLFFFFRDIRHYGTIQFLFVDHNSIFKVDPDPVSLWLHFLNRSMQGLTYLVFQCVLVFKVYKSNIVTAGPFKFTEIFNWVLVLTFAELIFYMATSVFYCIALLNLGKSQTMIRLSNGSLLLICISYFIVSVYLYFSPSLLYGWADHAGAGEQSEIESSILADHITEGLEETDHVIAVNEKVDIVPENVVAPYDDTVLSEFKYRFEKEVIGAGLFRQQGLKVQEVSLLCDIPPRALSYLLTNIYNKGFNDFINECRIDYVVDRLIKDDWKGLTLEGLAFESGFSSRTTFFLAFKKNKFVNPTQYLQMHNSGLLK
jgi:AraC-like DNA-binding protein